MSSRRDVPGFLDSSLPDENTMITDYWLEYITAREARPSAEESGHAPAAATGLTERVNSLLLVSQESLHRELDRIVQGIPTTPAPVKPWETEIRPPVSPVTQNADIIRDARPRVGLKDMILNFFPFGRPRRLT